MRYLPLLTLLACSKDPLKRGEYVIRMDTFTNDTCGLTPEAVGVGTVWTADLSWDGDLILLEGFRSDTSYAPVGDWWEAQSDSARETSVCIETFTEEHELYVVDETTLRIDATLRLGQRGNCDGVDTPAPCTYDLVYSGTRL